MCKQITKLIIIINSFNIKIINIILLNYLFSRESYNSLTYKYLVICTYLNVIFRLIIYFFNKAFVCINYV